MTNFHTQTKPIQARFGEYNTTNDATLFRIQYLLGSIRPISTVYNLLGISYPATIPSQTFYIAGIQAQFGMVSQMYGNVSKYLLGNFVDAPFPMLLDVASSTSMLFDDLRTKLNKACDNIQNFVGNVSAIATNIMSFNNYIGTNITMTLGSLNQTVSNLRIYMNMSIADAANRTANETNLSQVLVLQSNISSQIQILYTNFVNVSSNIYQKKDVYNLIYQQLDNIVTDSSPNTIDTLKTSGNLFKIFKDFSENMKMSIAIKQSDFINLANITFKNDVKIWKNWTREGGLYQQHNMTFANMTTAFDNISIILSYALNEFWNSVISFYQNVLNGMLIDSFQVSNLKYLE